MTANPDQVRRALISAGGAALLSNILPANVASAQPTKSDEAEASEAAERPNRRGAVSPTTAQFAEYISGTLDRELPEAVVAATKLHILDTVAAMVSGRSLKPGEIAARYVKSLGGEPVATVVGTGIMTSPVNAALANAMAAHADETDDTNPFGPFHAGCSAVPSALATAEMAGRSGSDMVRAVALAYDVGVRVLQSFGGVERHPGFLTNTFVATAASAALLRLDPRQVRYALSYAAQQASGVGSWVRDRDHIEKSFDYGGMGARNGVMAATMVAMGFTGVEDVFSGPPSAFTALAKKPAPEKLVAELGTRFEVFNTTIKKWTVGGPLQPVLDSLSTLTSDAAVRAGNIKRVVVQIPTESLAIVDNATVPDLCLQHLVAMMIADGQLTFASIHDEARMRDPKVLAFRKLVEVAPSEELQKALPVRRAIITIETGDGRTVQHRTDIVRGTAGNPMDAREVETKALDLMAPVLGRARAAELVTKMEALERVEAVSELRPLLRA
jgi:2-methylcitrate dehydratase PrpD